MNEKSLEKNLANLERELVNLQTAHDVGLGAVGFYIYQGDFWTFTYSGEWDDFPVAILMIDVLSGERADPLIDLYISSIYEDNTSGFSNAERVSSTKFDFYVSRLLYSGRIHMFYKVISSSRLSVRAATSYQDYVDWLNE